MKQKVQKIWSTKIYKYLKNKTHFSTTSIVGLILGGGERLSELLLELTHCKVTEKLWILNEVMTFWLAYHHHKHRNLTYFTVISKEWGITETAVSCGAVLQAGTSISARIRRARRNCFNRKRNVPNNEKLENGDWRNFTVFVIHIQNLPSEKYILEKFLAAWIIFWCWAWDHNICKINLRWNHLVKELIYYLQENSFLVV